MKKFVLKVVSTALAIISLVAVLFTFTGCNQVVKTHTLMTVKKNQSFEIVLHGPGGTHDWNYTISSEDNIEFVEKIKLFGDRFDENGYELIGGNALAVVYRFKINKVGTLSMLICLVQMLLLWKQVFTKLKLRRKFKELLL